MSEPQTNGHLKEVEHMLALMGEYQAKLDTYRAFMARYQVNYRRNLRIHITVAIAASAILGFNVSQLIERPWALSIAGTVIASLTLIFVLYIFVVKIPRAHRKVMAEYAPYAPGPDD